MGSTKGWKRGELPPSAALTMETLGFTYLPASEGKPFRAYRHHDHPKLLVHLAATNMPGEHDVIASLKLGDAVTTVLGRISTEELTAKLRAELHLLNGGTVWPR